MKLVRDWRHVWSYFSTQAMAIAGAVQMTWVTLPDDMRGSIPTEWVSYGTAALLALGVAGRFVKQKDMDHV